MLFFSSEFRRKKAFDFVSEWWATFLSCNVNAAKKKQSVLFFRDDHKIQDMHTLRYIR